VPVARWSAPRSMRYAQVAAGVIYSGGARHRPGHCGRGLHHGAGAGGGSRPSNRSADVPVLAAGGIMTAPDGGVHGDGAAASDRSVWLATVESEPPKFFARR